MVIILFFVMNKTMESYFYFTVMIAAFINIF